MNLLLFLSALLSALTGVGAQTRAPQAAATVRVAAEQVAEQAARIVARRPVAELPTRVAVAVGQVLVALPIRNREPIFAGRRRE